MNMILCGFIFYILEKELSHCQYSRLIIVTMKIDDFLFQMNRRHDDDMSGNLEDEICSERKQSCFDF